MNRPYRIGIDARFLRQETGGIGRYIRELISHLAEIDTENEYVVFITPADLPDWNLKAPNFRAAVTTAAHYTAAEQTRFLRELNREKLDLVHFTNFNHPVLYRRPFVTTLHDFTVYFHPVGRSQKSKVRRAAFTATFKRSLTAARKVIAISRHSARDAEKVFGIRQEKMRVVYEAGPSSPNVPADSRARVTEYLKTDKPYFLFVSQWRPHKGILTLIDAFDRFKESTGSLAKLVLTGKQKVLAEEVHAALESAKHKEDIIAPGFAPDELLPSLYHEAIACVIPSEYEGFGLMALEAFAYGTPAILANNSSLPEVGGDAAFYFETRDGEDLANRMSDVTRLDGEARELRLEHGKEQFAKFSWVKCARETLEVYREALAR